jgi:hypothetical protein
VSACCFIDLPTQPTHALALHIRHRSGGTGCASGSKYTIYLNTLRSPLHKHTWRALPGTAAVMLLPCSQQGMPSGVVQHVRAPIHLNLCCVLFMSLQAGFCVATVNPKAVTQNGPQLEAAPCRLTGSMAAVGLPLRLHRLQVFALLLLTGVIDCCRASVQEVACTSTPTHPPTEGVRRVHKVQTCMLQMLRRPHAHSHVYPLHKHGVRTSTQWH